MLVFALFLQLQSADSVYSTPALRDFIAQAAVQNRAPPLSLAGYRATVESELALIIRDSLGRELVGQIEQLAARAEWERSGRYELHVVGFRSQSMGAPYSALTFTRMYTVPTLYGNRLFLGMNDFLPRSRADTVAARKRQARNASSRCAALTPTHTATSPMASEPMRCTQAARVTPNFSMAAATMRAPSFSASSANASYSRRVTAWPSL